MYTHTCALEWNELFSRWVCSKPLVYSNRCPLASSEKLLKFPNVQAHPRPTGSQMLGTGPTSQYFSEIPRCAAKVESQCFKRLRLIQAMVL